MAGVLACVYFLRPPPVMLPVIAKSPPKVPEPITFRLARLLIPPFSMVKPPITALAPDATMLPAVTLNPPAEK